MFEGNPSLMTLPTPSVHSAQIPVPDSKQASPLDASRFSREHLWGPLRDGDGSPSGMCST